MAEFSYVALDGSGKRQRGRISAETKRDAVLRLREQRLTALEVNEYRKRGLLGSLREASGDSIWSMEIHFGQKVKSGEFAMFTRQMATLIRAGVPLADAVQVLAEQSENKTLGKALREIGSEILNGNQLSEAIVGYKDKHIFQPVFTNMVRAGEASGNLDEVLERLAVFFEKEHYTREKVKSALTYPTIVSVLAVCVTVFLLVKVVPTFVSVFASFNVQLPLPTRIVLGVSHFFVHQWYVVLALLIAVVGGYKLAVRNRTGRYWRDYVLLKTPVFGQLVLKSSVARMGRTLSSLLSSGVPIIQALRLSAEVVENEVIRRALQDSEESLTTGQTLSDPYERSKLFPPLVIQMIKVGEETGNLDFMLTKIADFYETETEAMVDRMKSLLEPLLMLVLSVIVGTIITAVLTPMFSLYSQVGSLG